VKQKMILREMNTYHNTIYPHIMCSVRSYHNAIYPHIIPCSVFSSIVSQYDLSSYHIVQCVQFDTITVRYFYNTIYSHITCSVRSYHNAIFPHIIPCSVFIVSQCDLSSYHIVQCVQFNTITVRYFYNTIYPHITCSVRSYNNAIYPYILLGNVSSLTVSHYDIISCNAFTQDKPSLYRINLCI